MIVLKIRINNTVNGRQEAVGLQISQDNGQVYASVLKVLLFHDVTGVCIQNEHFFRILKNFVTPFD